MTYDHWHSKKQARLWSTNPNLFQQYYGRQLNCTKYILLTALPSHHYLLFNFFIIILIASTDCTGRWGEGGALRVILWAPVAIPSQLVTLCGKTAKEEMNSWQGPLLFTLSVQQHLTKVQNTLLNVFTMCYHHLPQVTEPKAAFLAFVFPLPSHTLQTSPHIACIHMAFVQPRR